ncbi:MAG: DUF4340 domain-containing protein [Balneolaceae bacterium]|nr:DUF4340 domain-containing protein [Balneolaceae bacterium]
MKNIHPTALKFAIGALILGLVYVLLVLFENVHHTHEEDGVVIQGHEDHMHVTYQPVFEIEPTEIQSITAYFPAERAVISIRDGMMTAGQLSSDCTDLRDWSAHQIQADREEQLTEREYREFRNLYSKITPDFRINTLPEGEDYGLLNPDGCISIQTEDEQYFFQFGRQSAQGFSRYMRINRMEPVYVVSRYFYTELQNFIERD